MFLLRLSKIEFGNEAVAITNIVVNSVQGRNIRCLIHESGR